MSDERKKALKRCETATPAFKKNGDPKLRKGKQCYTRRYECEVCGKKDLKAPKEFQIDHKFPCGGFIGSKNTPKWWTVDIYFSRLFCKAEDLQGICISCHQNKTANDKESMRNGKFYQDLAKVYQKDTDK